MNRRQTGYLTLMILGAILVAIMMASYVYLAGLSA